MASIIFDHLRKLLEHRPGTFVDFGQVRFGLRDRRSLLEVMKIRQTSPRI